MKSLVIRSDRGLARADRHDVRGRPVAYVVRWEVVVDGELTGGSVTYPIHADGAQARGFAWGAAVDAAEGRPPKSVLRTSWPVVCVQVVSAA